MSTKLDAALSEVESLIAAATVSAKKKPQHAVEKDAKGKWRIRSMKDGKLWPQTYDTKEMANKGLAAYHLRKKGVPPKKTKAAAECPECGSEAKIDMRGKHCPECGWSDAEVSASGLENMIREKIIAISKMQLKNRRDLIDTVIEALLGLPEVRSLSDKELERMVIKELAAFESDTSKETVEAAAECPECGADYEGETCDHCGCGTSASSKTTVKAAPEPTMSYDPRDKQMLRKLKRMVDRGYLSADEVAGAVMEALHAAKVSTRMAGAIAEKIKEALVDAEEDVIDVSAKAKLAAKAKLDATRRK